MTRQNQTPPEQFAPADTAKSLLSAPGQDGKSLVSKLREHAGWRKAFAIAFPTRDNAAIAAEVAADALNLTEHPVNDVLDSWQSVKQKHGKNVGVAELTHAVANDLNPAPQRETER